MSYAQNSIWKLIKLEDGVKTEVYQFSDKELKEILKGRDNDKKRKLLLKI